ncbi:hypothetical protein CGZ90_04845 [Fictibacillus aquaticus]|uniref:Uncharacterized protein n=2 Tax=Fictibacillus aquaticus TaxID=2021314 RepID=A0A235FCX0_9BACL|nr:hypothetical protein CGZ90_04845 [Fictibacillus aquaticus]
MNKSTVSEERKIIWESGKKEEGNVVPFPTPEAEEAFRTHVEINSPGTKPASIIYITSGFGNINAGSPRAIAA